MRRLSLTAVAVVLLLPAVSRAGEADAGSWMSLSLQHKFSPRLNVTLRGEWETCDMFSRIGTWYVRAIGRYKVLPWLSAELTADSFNTYIRADDAFRHSFRIHTGALASWEKGQFKFTLLEREYFYIVADRAISYRTFLLSHARIAWNIPKSRFSLYMAGYWFNRPELFQRRLSAGVSCRVTDSVGLSLYYLNKLSPLSGEITNIAGLSCSVKL